jgi:hypothetical protein
MPPFAKSLGNKQRPTLLELSLRLVFASLAPAGAVLLPSAAAMAQAETEPSIHQIYEAAQAGATSSVS